MESQDGYKDRNSDSNRERNEEVLADEYAPENELTLLM